MQEGDDSVAAAFNRGGAETGISVSLDHCEIAPRENGTALAECQVTFSADSGSGEKAVPSWKALLHITTDQERKSILLLKNEAETLPFSQVMSFFLPSGWRAFDLTFYESHSGEILATLSMQQDFSF